MTMITDDLRRQMRMESVLSEGFCMARDSNGDMVAAFGDRVVDHAALCMFILWSLHGNTLYTGIASSNADRLIEMNQQHPAIGASNFEFIDQLFLEFIHRLGDASKPEIADRYDELMRNLAADG